MIIVIIPLLKMNLKSLNLFDRIETHPLSLAQRKSIVTDEDSTLVVAGAGTGKTSTVVGKVSYL